MKFTVRRFAGWLAVSLCFSALLTACGGASSSDGSMAVSPGDAGAEDAAYYTAFDGYYGEEDAPESYGEADYNEVADADASEDARPEESAGITLPARSGNVSLSEKIIYSADANIETTAFDETIEKVYAMLDLYDAFVENSYIDGSGYRSANFTLRVPRESFAAMTNGLSDLGNLLSVSNNAVNIQTQYTDTESRLTAYRTEEERLLAMLAAVKDVESMIAIESRLSNVRYEIESLTSRLRDWQNQVDYSSVTLYIREVDRLSTQVQPGKTYGQELSEGFVGTLHGIGAFFKELFKIVIVFLPALVLLAVVAFAAFIVVKKTRARRATKRAAREETNGDADRS
jgi:hypothetical protein